MIKIAMTARFTECLLPASSVNAFYSSPARSPTTMLMRELLDHYFHFTDEKIKMSTKMPKAQRGKGAHPESPMQAAAELGFDPGRVTPEPTFSITCSTGDPLP